LPRQQQALAEVRGIMMDIGRSVEKLTGAAPTRVAAAVDRCWRGQCDERTLSFLCWSF
jgi:hypothetical protein